MGFGCMDIEHELEKQRDGTKVSKGMGLKVYQLLDTGL